MKTIPYAGAIVFPNKESVFLYEIDSEMKKFLSTVVEANVTESSVNSSKKKIADRAGINVDKVHEYAYSKTSMLMLKSFEDLKDKGVVNLDEIVSMSSQYEEITKLKAIKSELVAYRNTPFSDVIVPIHVKIDDAFMIQFMMIVIYAPNDWNERKATIALEEQNTLEQVNANVKGKRVGDEQAPGKSSTDSLSAYVLQKGIGSSRSGTIVAIQQLSSVIHPFEVKVVQSALGEIKRSTMNTNDYIIGEQNALRFMRIADYVDGKKAVDAHNDGKRYTVDNEKLTLRTTALSEITDDEYVSRVKKHEPVKYESESFKVDDASSLLIYAPPGAGKSEFITENNLTLLVLDTDYSQSQLKADVVMTNRHELIPRYDNTFALLYAEQDWNSLVRAKMSNADGDPVQPGWYKSMYENVSKAKHVVHAGRGKYVADYINVLHGVESVRKEMVLSVHKGEKEGKKEDKQDVTNEAQQSTVKKLTDGPTLDEAGDAPDAKTVNIDSVTPETKGKHATQKKRSLKKGSANFFK